MPSLANVEPTLGGKELASHHKTHLEHHQAGKGKGREMSITLDAVSRHLVLLLV